MYITINNIVYILYLINKVTESHRMLRYHESLAILLKWGV